MDSMAKVRLTGNPIKGFTVTVAIHEEWLDHISRMTIDLMGERISSGWGFFGEDKWPNHRIQEEVFSSKESALSSVAKARASITRIQEELSEVEEVFDVDLSSPVKTKRFDIMITLSSDGRLNTNMVSPDGNMPEIVDTASWGSTCIKICSALREEANRLGLKTYMELNQA